MGLDYGDPGAGHGHPDRLNLVIATRHARWLDDVGTGSYTAPTLSWYRSSVAHNAPLVNGLDQGAARGVLLAHDEIDDAGWVSAAFTEPRSGVSFVRTVVVTRDHVLDELTWIAPGAVTVDLPMQVQMVTPGGADWLPFEPGTTQDDALGSAHARQLGAGEMVLFTLRGMPSPAVAAADAAAPLFVTALHSESAATLWCAATIGPPAGQPHGMISLRQQGTSGRSVRVIAAPESVASVGTAAGVDVTSTDGTITRHRRIDAGWQLELQQGAARTTVRLGGVRPAPPDRVECTGDLASGRRVVLPLNASVEFVLAESSYRPTEASWTEAGAPTATVSVRHPDGSIEVVVNVTLYRPPCFAPACDVNPLDNELADVNSDGVQVHWRSAISGAWNGALAVPEPSGVRLTAAEGALDGLHARRLDGPPDGHGFALAFVLPWPDAAQPLQFDCCINERPADRERRRGQLVLSGAEGESAYLRGARQGAERALTIILDQPAS